MQHIDSVAQWLSTYNFCSMESATTVQYVSMWYHVRNDGSEERHIKFRVFDAKEKALDHAIARIRKLHCLRYAFSGDGNDYLSEPQQKLDLIEYMASGGSLWVPEWDRKGNGDQFTVRATEHAHLYTKQAQTLINEHLCGAWQFSLEGGGDARYLNSVLADCEASRANAAARNYTAQEHTILE